MEGLHMHAALAMNYSLVFHEKYFPSIYSPTPKESKINTYIFSWCMTAAMYIIATVLCKTVTVFTCYTEKLSFPHAPL